jgi:hypothetical protein
LSYYGRGTWWSVRKVSPGNLGKNICWCSSLIPSAQTTLPFFHAGRWYRAEGITSAGEYHSPTLSSLNAKFLSKVLYIQKFSFFCI